MPDAAEARTRLEAQLAELEGRLSRIERDLAETPTPDSSERAVQMEDDEALEGQAVVISNEIASVRRARADRRRQLRRVRQVRKLNRARPARRSPPGGGALHRVRERGLKNYAVFVLNFSSSTPAAISSAGYEGSSAIRDAEHVVVTRWPNSPKDRRLP